MLPWLAQQQQDRTPNLSLSLSLNYFTLRLHSLILVEVRLSEESNMQIILNAQLRTFNEWEICKIRHWIIEIFWKHSNKLFSKDYEVCVSHTFVWFNFTVHSFLAPTPMWIVRSRCNSALPRTAKYQKLYYYTIIKVSGNAKRRRRGAAENRARGSWWRIINYANLNLRHSSV